MAMAMLNALTFVISVEVYLWFCLVLGCVVGEVYPCEVGNNYTLLCMLLMLIKQITWSSFERSHILRSWLCMHLDVARIVLRTGRVYAAEVRLHGLSTRLRTMETEVSRVLQVGLLSKYFAMMGN